MEVAKSDSISTMVCVWSRLPLVLSPNYSLADIFDIMSTRKKRFSIKIWWSAIKRIGQLSNAEWWFLYWPGAKLWWWLEFPPTLCVAYTFYLEAREKRMFWPLDLKVFLGHLISKIWQDNGYQGLPFRDLDAGIPDLYTLAPFGKIRGHCFMTTELGGIRPIVPSRR